MPSEFSTLPPVIRWSICFLFVALIGGGLYSQSLHSAANLEAKPSHESDSKLALVYAGNKVVPPPTSEEQLEKFEVAEGYSVNLFADETLGVINPIQMTWDPSGRLWVCCAPSYPQASPGERPNDFILILEDTDNDGKADQSTKFAEGLYMPTGFELGDGGAYVVTMPDLWHLRDTDGDDIADEREIVFTGFGTEDSHTALSTFRWGPGGKLYMVEGDFSHSQIETPHGLVNLIFGGIFEFTPRTRRLEVYADAHVTNPWGHFFNRWGEELMGENPRIVFVPSLTGSGPIKTDFLAIAATQGGKNCSGEFISGRHIPDANYNDFMMCAYKSSQVFRYRMHEEGSSYTIENRPWLLKTSGPFFRPVDVKMGPDGGIYVCDWLNQVIGHTQHDQRDPRRDHQHGRIWRVTHNDRPLVEKPNLTDCSLPELLDHLKDPEDWTRNQVRRVLYHTDADTVAAALDTWVEGLDPSDADYTHHLLEALWSYQVAERPRADLLRRLLVAEDHRARTAALHVMRYWVEEFEDWYPLLDRAVQDVHARVRLEAMLTLGFVPDERAITLAVKVIDHPMDRFLEEGLDCTIAGLLPHSMDAYNEDRLVFEREEHAERALGSVDGSLAIRPILRAYESSLVTSENVHDLMLPVVHQAGNDQLDAVWSAFAEYAGRLPLDKEIMIGTFAAFERARVERGAIPSHGVGAHNLRRLGEHMKSSDPDVQLAARRLAFVWNERRIRPRVADVVAPLLDEALDLEERIRVAELFIYRGASQYNPVAREILEDDASTITAKYLATFMHLSGASNNAERVLANVLALDPDGADPTFLLEVVIQNRGGAAALAAAMENTPPHPAAAQVVLQFLNEVGEQNAALVAAVTPASDLTPLADLLLEIDIAQLSEEVEAQGDAANGQLVFQRESLTCVKCHTVGAEQHLIGPDLALIGRSEIDYLIDSLLEPSKVIKEQFVNVSVFTIEGRVYSGILRYQSDDEVIIRSGIDGEDITISGDRIEEVVHLQSLMPLGLVNQLSRQEFLDLVKYLTTCR